MLEGLTTKFVVAGVAALAVCVTIYLGYRHYTGLVEDLAVAQQNVAIATAALEQEKRTLKEAVDVIADWKTATEEMKKVQLRIDNLAKEARNEAAKTEQLFARHDTETLARTRPGLIERRVNRASAAARRMLECASSPSGRCAGEAGPAR